jgi:hypothetical protein
MYKITNEGVPTPTANLAINKSRIKVYGKSSEVPTYYLQKGQEFQIELFNPTKDTILAKISLNGKPIAQGGLVLKPAQRVFLDRYIDVAKKFKFDTYEVANTSESRAAIEDNGDFKVEFYKESIPIDYNPTFYGSNTLNINNGSWGNTTTDARGIIGTLTTTNVNYNQTIDSYPTLDSLSFMDQTLEGKSVPLEEPRKKLRSKKSIETGRVEKGSYSDQTLTTVYMNWETRPFYKIEYKMLPISHKVNTVEDTQVKRYCTNCGNKSKVNFKFCPMCGDRI